MRKTFLFVWVLSSEATKMLTDDGELRNTYAEYMVTCRDKNKKPSSQLSK